MRGGGGRGSEGEGGVRGREREARLKWMKWEVTRSLGMAFSLCSGGPEIREY